MDSTIVLCAGEFGRMPRLNPNGGGDHWSHGISITLAGGGLRGVLAIGETSPELSEGKPDVDADVKRPVSVEEVRAKILKTLGINPRD